MSTTRVKATRALVIAAGALGLGALATPLVRGQETPPPTTGGARSETTAPDDSKTTATTAPVGSAAPGEVAPEVSPALTGGPEDGGASGLLPVTPPPPTKDAAPAHEPPGFGQDEGEAPRIPRIRLEGAYLGALFDSTARIGHTGASNTINPHEDLHLGRYLDGGRGEIVLKLHRWVAVGLEYLEFGGESAREPVKRDIRLGGVVPTEVPQGYRASGVLEFQETQVSLRLVLVDEAPYRCEFTLGSSWVSYRLGVHPGYPFATPPLPGFGQPEGTSRRVESYFGPALGLFFCWNIVDRFAIFLEQHSAYLAVRLGSIESLVRLGARIRIVGGVELVLGGFLVDGQLYDAQDRYSSRSKGHITRNVYWLGGGPDVGLSVTY